MKAILPVFETYDSDPNRTVMQFYADMMKSLNSKGLISVDDLYQMSEAEVNDLILNSGDEYLVAAFKNFQSATTVFGSDEPVEGKYCI